MLALAFLLILSGASLLAFNDDEGAIILWAGIAVLGLAVYNEARGRARRFLGRRDDGGSEPYDWGK